MTTTRPSSPLCRRVLRTPNSELVLAALLRRISVGLGYVPSWGSPRVRITARRALGGDEALPGLEVDREPIEGWPPMLQSLVRSMMKVAPAWTSGRWCR